MNQNGRKTVDQSSRETSQLCHVFHLILDIIIVHIKIYYYIIEGIFKSFFNKEETSVRGEIVLITGTGHGIGKEVALEYAGRGAKVICWDINEKTNTETVKEINEMGGQAYGYICNVMERSDIIKLAEKVKKEVGFVSIVVNNAGIMPTHPLLQHTETEIRNLFEINVLAHFWILQCFLPDMIEQNRGHIVALSSCAGLFGLKNIVPYCSTKYAVRGTMQSLAEELRANNPNTKIKLTTIYPYMVDTGLCKNPHFRFPSLMKLVKPQEAARAIVNAQTTGVEEVSIPKSYLVLEAISRILPLKCGHILNDFLDTGLHSDLQ